MSGVSVQIVGDKEVIGVLRRYRIVAAQRIREVVNIAAVNVQRIAKRLCAVDTGRLRSSIAIKFYVNGLGATVGTNVEYGSHIEFGTQGHRVLPIKGKFLSWVNKDGQRVFAKSVYVPARPARPFLFPAWDEVRPQVIRDLTAALDGAAREASA